MTVTLRMCSILQTGLGLNPKICKVCLYKCCKLFGFGEGALAESVNTLLFPLNVCNNILYSKWQIAQYLRQDGTTIYK